MEAIFEWFSDFLDWSNQFQGAISFVTFIALILGGLWAFIYNQKQWEKLEGWLADPVNYPELLNKYKNSTEDVYFRSIRNVSYFVSRTYGRKPFSLKAFGVSLTIAYFYPLVAAFFAWLIANSASPGGLILFHEVNMWWDRLLRGAIIVFSLLPLTWITHNNEALISWGRDKSLKVLDAISSRIGFLPNAIRELIAESLGVIAFANTLFSALAVAAFGAAAGAVADVSAFALAVAAAFVVAIAKAGAVAGAFAGAIIGAAAIAMAYAVAGAEGVFLSTSLTVVFFFVLLPIANACADFLSVGATRMFLLHIARRRSPTRMIAFGVFLDLIIAATCLGLLLALMVGSLDLWTWLSPNTVPLDWRVYWAEIQSDWWSGMALGLMLMTTILPSIIHLAAGVGGILTHKSRRQKRAAERIQEHIDKGEVMTGIMAHNTMRLVRGATLWGYGLSTTGVLTLFGILLWWVF